MKTYIISLIFIFMMSGCSFKTVQKFKYRVNASNSFESYTNYYLQGQTRLASISLRRALKSAKQGYDMNSLAKIYLGECALHIGVLINDKCNEYLQIKHLLKNNSLQEYYYILQNKFSKIDATKVPARYKDFVYAVKNKTYNKAFKAIKNMKNISSMLISSSIIKNHLTKYQIKYVIDKSSSMGYKKATKRWYEFLRTKSSKNEQKLIDEKVKIFN